MRKLKLRKWVKVTLYIIFIMILTYLIALRIDYLARLGY